MADKIKKFFAKKMIDAKFKKAGPGHRLTDTPSDHDSETSKPKVVRSQDDICEESRVAAAAALARLGQKRENAAFNTSLAAIQAQVRKELESEKEKESPASKQCTSADTGKPTNVPANYSVGGVYFRCPLVSEEVLSREEWKVKIKEFLYAQLEDERGLTAALIMHSCNTGREKIEACVNTLCKYLENIVTYPDEEKYRRIRMSNRVFAERVQCIEGAMDFLQAAGFVEKTLPGPDGNDDQFLVFSEEKVTSVDSLVTLIDALRSAEPLPLELDRGVRVLYASQANKYRDLPPEFYCLRPEEIKREQQLRMEAIEKSQMLRTKAMREKEELREMKRYKFALVRVRFPDGILLQGTFSVYEQFSEVVDFVKKHIELSDLPFTLTSPTGDRLSNVEDANKTLLDLKLVPTSVLMFSWDSSVLEDINKSPNKDVYLKPEVMMLVQDIVN